MAGKDVIALRDAKTKIYESYGMTETASHIALKHLNGPDTEKDMAVPFTALPGIMLSQDEKGCLMIQLPWDPGQTIHTNDIVSLTDSDQFYWLGRSDNVINSGGVKLHPEMIEDKLCGLIDNRFIMMGVADEELGQRLIMVLEGLAEESEVMTTIKEHKTIEKYEIPKEIFKMEKFPETGNGKVNRPEIHNWVLNL
jgi:O-succinylbenzoic acid--CoA ligase